MALAGQAHAQSAPPAASEGDEASYDEAVDANEIVVTGSQIRGIAPAGSTVIGFDAKQVEATGGTSAFDVLARMPQVVNAFQGLPSPGNNNPAGARTSSITRPNLRNIPNLNNSTGPLTLVMIDGHRLVPQGVEIALVDPEAVPASLLARVEALPDGASAVYGSDAVTGVINFITKDRFDGIEVSARGGLAKDYWSYNFDVTAGHNWSNGGVYASVSYSKHDWLLGAERDYIASLDYNPLSPTYLQGVGTSCTPANVSVSSRFYPVSAAGVIQPYTVNGGTASGGGGNRCDLSEYNTAYPRTTRIGVMAGLRQQLSDRLKFDMRFYWQQRLNEYNSGPFAQTFTATPANLGALYRPVPVVPGSGLAASEQTASQTIRFVYTPLGNYANPQRLESSFWQITPRFTYNITDDWQARVLATYGESRTLSKVYQIDPDLQSARILSGLINPYNIGASGAGAFDNLVRETQKYGEFRFLDTKVVVDGPLFSLPGGQVRAAFGAEYMKTNFEQNILQNPTYTYGVPKQASQSVWSVFGELQVPIVGEDNAMPFLHRFSISGSVRHDQYNDFGGTNNFSAGATLAPVDWLKFRATYGTSFSAPTAVDAVGLSAVRALVINNAAAIPPFTPAAQGGTTLPGAVILFLSSGVVGGLPGEPTLQPQTSRNWSVGFDAEPPILPGLKLSLNYYNLRINGQLGFPGQGSAQSVINTYPQFIYCSNYPAPPTTAACNTSVSPALVAQYAAIADPASLASAAGGTSYNAVAAGIANGTIPVQYIVDTRARNLGRIFVRGIDYSASYRTETGFGSMDASFSGNLELSRTGDGGSPAISFTNYSDYDNPLVRWSLAVGANVGAFRGQVTWQHTGGYDIRVPGTPGNGITGAQAPFGQMRVDAFNTVNLFFKYDFQKEGALKDLSLTLNIDNLFDTSPPFLSNGNGFSAINGITLGRFFQLGVRKAF